EGVQEAFLVIRKNGTILQPARSRGETRMSPGNSPPVRERLPSGLGSVEEAIRRACKEARRDRASVTLVAVTKTFNSDAIKPAIEAGQVVFGENRVQEARSKWPALMAAYPGIALHLIGPLQSNKTKE